MSRKPPGSSDTRTRNRVTSPRPSVAEYDASADLLYTFVAALLSGPLPESFARNNPTISRTLQMRGDHTLHQVHLAVAPAFGLEPGPGYEFQLGQKPSPGVASQYVPPEAVEETLATRADHARLDALRLKVGDGLTYWLEDGDGWWFRLELHTVENGPAKGRFPRVTERIGRNPPRQKAGKETGPQELGGIEAADTACLVGELHLHRGDNDKAVEAFTRAITLRPTADAYQGRARAYRAIAAVDDKRAVDLK